LARTRLPGFGRRLVGQGGHHLLHVFRFGCLILGCGAAAGGGRRTGLRQRGTHRGGKLILREGVAAGKPLGKGGLQLVAGDDAVLILVGRGEDTVGGCPASAAASGGGGLLGLQGDEGAGAKGRGANTSQQRSSRGFERHDTSVWTEHRTNVHGDSLGYTSGEMESRVLARDNR
jgi:hypothetical protein